MTDAMTDSAEPLNCTFTSPTVTMTFTLSAWLIFISKKVAAYILNSLGCKAPALLALPSFVQRVGCREQSRRQPDCNRGRAHVAVNCSARELAGGAPGG